MNIAQEKLYTNWHQSTVLRHGLELVLLDYARRNQRPQIQRVIDRAHDREARRWFAFVRAS